MNLWWEAFKLMVALGWIAAIFIDIPAESSRHRPEAVWVTKILCLGAGLLGCRMLLGLMGGWFGW